MGYLPKEIWKLDRRYGVKVLEDPTLIEGITCGVFQLPITLRKIHFCKNC